jgi:hypothetical protein
MKSVSFYLARWLLSIFFALKMEAKHFCGTSVNFYRATRLRIPDSAPQGNYFFFIFVLSFFDVNCRFRYPLNL